MPGIEKINLWNSASRQNIKNVLGYAVKKRNGYYKDIKMVDERRGDTIESFATAGFLNIGHTLKERTFGITELGEEYYRDVFGDYNYWSEKIAGKWERFKKRLFNKESK
jgi:hypothetical protein